MFLQRKFRHFHRRLIDRIELMRVHGWLAKLFRDPDKVTRWIAGMLLPFTIAFVMHSSFYMNSKVETEMMERERRRELHARRKLHLSAPGSTADDDE